MSVAAAEKRRARIIRRYHFHVGGLLYVAVTAFLAIGALNSQNNLMFAALGLAIGGLLVSGVISGSSMMGLRVERTDVVAGPAGELLRIQYKVSNVNRFTPAFALHIEEVGDDSTWRRHMPRPRGFVGHVGPGQTINAETLAWPRRRGTARFTAVRLWTTFPLGIAKKSVTFRLDPLECVIRPVQVPLRPDALSIASESAFQGGRPRQRVGSGEEFFGLRKYSPGDPIRSVAWRVSARAGQLLTSQRAAPTPMRTWIVLNEHGASSEETERAIALSASLIALAARNASDVGLVIPTSGVSIPPVRSTRALDRLLEELGALEETPRAPDGTLIDRIPARDRVVVVHAGESQRAIVTRPCIHLSGRQLGDFAVDLKALERFEATLAWVAGRPLASRIVDRGASFLDDLLSPLPREAM